MPSPSSFARALLALLAFAAPAHGYEMLVDPTKALTFDEARQSSHWVPRAEHTEFRDADVWVRLPVAKPAGKETRHLLVVDEGYPTLAELFLLDENGALLGQARGGASVPSVERAVDTNRCVFDLPLAAGRTATAYLRLRYVGMSFTDVSVAEAEPWITARQAQHLGAGLYFGAALALFFHNFALFIASRERAFLYYLGMVFCVAVTSAHLNGYLAMVTADFPLPVYRAAPFFPPLSVAFAAAFAVSFLRLGTTAPRVARLLHLLAAVAMSLPLVALVSFPLAGRLAIPLIVLTTTTIAVASLRMALRGDRHAWAFFIARSLPATTFLVFVGHTLVGRAFPLPLMLLVVFLIEMLLMSVSLTLRLRDALEGEVAARTAVIADQQARMASASRMSALGEMAGGVAHEINNPLMVIKGASDLLEDQARVGDMTTEDVLNATKRIKRTVDRMAQIVRGMRLFARESSDDPMVPVQIGALMDDTLAFCRERFSHHGVELRTSIDRELVVSGRQSQLSQILLNLLNNAFDAVKELKTERWVELSAASVGGQVELGVTDSGPGVPDEARSRLFQPFFTTKPPGAGTGLGLSIARGLVTAHGGTIECLAAGGASRFVVRLPRA